MARYILAGLAGGFLVVLTVTPWLVLIALLLTAAVMGPLVALAVRHHRQGAVQAPTTVYNITINNTYNTAHLHEAAPGVGAATYRQLPGTTPAIGWPGQEEGPRR
jgi:hypothetical protein